MIFCYPLVNQIFKKKIKSRNFRIINTQLTIKIRTSGLRPVFLVVSPRTIQQLTQKSQAPSKTMSYSSSVARKSAAQIIAEDRAKKNLEVSPQSSQHTPDVVVTSGKLLKYPVFSLQNIKDITTEKMGEDLLEKSGGRFQSFKGLLMPDNKTTFKWTQIDIRGSPDKKMWSDMNRQYDDLKSQVDYANIVFRSNGTRKGLANRILQQLTKPNPKIIPKILPGEEKHFFFSKSIESVKF